MKKIDKARRPPLALNIMTLRKRLGWSQEELAHATGVHVNTIKDIERGLSEGRPETRQSIATALNSTVAELFSDQGAAVVTEAKLETPTAAALLAVVNEQAKEIDSLKSQLAQSPSAAAAALFARYQMAPQHVRDLVDSLLDVDFDVETVLSRLPQPLSKSKPTKP